MDKENIAYIHRDKLNDVNYESKAIMNGWFSHYPENWPPSDKIYPLFVSFHINSAVYDTLLSDKSIEYFKKYEPIGCRDKTTAEKLQEKGVNAYFSSCLTTTLGYKYHSAKKVIQYMLLMLFIIYLSLKGDYKNINLPFCIC